MGEIEKLEGELSSLNSKLHKLHTLEDEIWPYHPKNPNFINPITLFEKIQADLKVLERKIDEVTFKINSLN
jgi:hypothetical protein